MGVISNAKLRTAAFRLAKGQVWRLQHAYIQIGDLGKRLLEYRMLDFLGQRGVKLKMSSVEVMRDYLATRHARLMRNLTDTRPERAVASRRN
jgi:hypothetical protein